MVIPTSKSIRVRKRDCGDKRTRSNAPSYECPDDVMIISARNSITLVILIETV